MAEDRIEVITSVERRRRWGAESIGAPAPWARRTVSSASAGPSKRNIVVVPMGAPLLLTLQPILGRAH